MTPDEAEALVREETSAWLSDPSSDVVWAGTHEGRWGLRMRQTVREATTVWFEVGTRTVTIDAYLLPAPPAAGGDAYRIALARNRRSWPVAINVDDRGDLFITGRIPLTDLSRKRLGQAVGAVYQVVEITFLPLIRAGFAPREKTS